MAKKTDFKFGGTCVGGPYDGQDMVWDVTTVDVLDNIPIAPDVVGAYSWSRAEGGTWIWEPIVLTDPQETSHG